MKSWGEVANALFSTSSGILTTRAAKSTWQPWLEKTSNAGRHSTRTPASERTRTTEACTAWTWSRLRNSSGWGSWGRMLIGCFRQVYSAESVHFEGLHVKHALERAVFAPVPPTLSHERWVLKIGRTPCMMEITEIAIARSSPW